MTIYSAQGMTLDAVYIYLSSNMQAGEAYTAFSRVKTRDTLGLSYFSDSAVKCNPHAIAYELRNTKKQQLYSMATSATFSSSSAVKVVSTMRMKSRNVDDDDDEDC